MVRVVCSGRIAMSQSNHGGHGGAHTCGGTRAHTRGLPLCSRREFGKNATDAWRDISLSRGRSLVGQQRLRLLGGSASVWTGDYAAAGCLFPFSTGSAPRLFYGERCPGKDLVTLSPNVTDVCNRPCPKGTCRCGNTSEYLPAAQWMHLPAQDAVFAESASRWTWPVAAAAAGSFYRWDGGLHANSTRELARRLRAVTARLELAGVDTCAFDAAGCPGGCTYTTRCGVPYRARGRY